MPDWGPFDWQRYWVPRRGVIPMDIDGFPMDPESRLGKVADFKLQTFDQIARNPCLALLGVPGLGKSTALEGIRSGSRAKPNVEKLFCDVRSFGSDERLYRAIFESPEFKGWVNSTHSLDIILDSLDECLIHIRTVAALLIDELRKYPRSRLRLRIACRTGEWPSIFSEELPKLWPEFEAFELAPLLRRDVAQALTSANIPHDAFFNSIERHNAIAFARSPLTLRFLLKTWDGSQFPTDTADLYLKGCRELCREQNSNRKDIGTRALNPDQAMVIAERIAGLMILGKKAAISPDISDSPDEVAYSEMAGGTEGAEDHSVEVNEGHLREVVISSGLFNGRGRDRMGWSHWSFAEFLAARFIATRIKDHKQICDLVMYPDRSITPMPQVIPQLRETVAWLCAMKPDFVPEVIRGSPEILVRSARVTVASEFRQQLVVSLLDQAGSGGRRRREWFTRDDYSVLVYPGLAEQLRPVILDPQRDIDVRDLAIDIGHGCHLKELLPDVTRLVLDPAEPLFIRTASGYFVRNIDQGTNAPYAIQLKALLTLPPEQDPDDDLKGIALGALWPSHLKAEELFDLLTTPKTPTRIGAYAAFFSTQFIKQLKPSHLSPALAWATKQTHDHLLPIGFQSALSGIFELACNHTDDPIVLEALANWIVERLKKHESLTPARSGDRSESLIRVDVEIRRRILQRVVPMLTITEAPSPHFHPIGPRGLVSTDDLGWLIAKAKAEEDPAMQQRWFACISQVWNRGDLIANELVLDAAGGCQAVKAAFGIHFDPIEIESSGGRKLKAEFLRWLRLEKRNKGTFLNSKNLWRSCCVGTSLPPKTEI